MTTSPSGSRIHVKGAVMDTYVAYRDEDGVKYYIEDLDGGIFTENRATAQRFEGPGWADRVAAVGAVLERVI